MAVRPFTNQFNSEVTKWAQGSRREMRKNILRLVTHVGAGYNQQKTSVKKYHGEASRIDFRFPLHMVFVHKGAGRGYGGRKTGKFSKSNGAKGLTAKGSLGKMGTGRRKPKPWFNPVIEDRFPELARLIASYHAGKVILNIKRLLIN